MPPTSPKGSSRSKNANEDSRSSGRKFRRERRAARRLAQSTREDSGSYTKEPEDKRSSKTAKNASDKATTFEENEDFIPFSDISDEEAGPSTRKEEKGREERKETNDRNKPDSTMSERARDKSRMRERDSDRGGDRDERDSSRRSSGKRRHDEYDDGYANKKQRVDAASRKAPWVNGLDLERCQNVAEMLHWEVDAFVNWISPTPVEDEIRGLVVSQITKCVTAAFPDAVVFPFGSYQTKLYLPLGDIDLVVLSDSMAYSDKATVLHVMANALKRHGITSHVTIIAKAKVPIVKFTTTHGRFKVDISINQGNGLVSGQIITGFLKDMIPSAKGKESKALRSLVMITKAFLSQRSMNEVYTGGLGSYAIVCLAVSFLQMHPKIRRGEIDPEKNLGVLVMEFFELYGNHFNYDEVGISLRDGGTYFNKRQRGWHAEYKRNMLSIEDPADPSNDISSGSYNFHKVRTAFSGCHGILTSTAYMRAGILSSRHKGRSVPLRGHYEPEDLSILSTVMGITQETINHRRLVQELYDRRVLHNILGVKPQPIVIQDSDDEVDDERRKDSKTSHVIESVWENGDRQSDSDNDDAHLRRNGHTGDDDGGRYAIGRQPPKKRRRTGREEDSHTVYLEDDDEDEEELSFGGGRRGDANKVDELEDGEYSSNGSDEEDRPGRFQKRDDPKRDARRSYWLSKAIGIGGGVADADAT
ncbi:Poly(A) RNA polymerase cid14 [Psilocybe cubensis]|uniref:Poly(A) RNA polymerase cid14 n=2 Tax=Psilocybe cubensis TaxID=181762 RepID=A0ACB8H974_PSICU|nr:Poly(A) RNA polymerase cid14 [Psilocybe cubensis]KAH9484478.1 Poly(A) RNA polymerase cid14 [Psilocybe cubensis]